jgi:hypothetical protein
MGALSFKVESRHGENGDGVYHFIDDGNIPARRRSSKGNPSTTRPRPLAADAVVATDKEKKKEESKKEKSKEESPKCMHCGARPSTSAGGRTGCGGNGPGLHGLILERGRLSRADSRLGRIRRP